MQRPPAREITLARLTYLVELPDDELCTKDIRTARVPASRLCGRRYIHPDTGQVTTCPEPGTRVRKPPHPGRPARRGCIWCVAEEIRAEHWLHRRRIELGLIEL